MRVEVLGLERCPLPQDPNRYANQQLCPLHGPPGEGGGGPGLQAQASRPFPRPQVRSAIRKRWHRWQDKHSIRARVARAMSIPTSPTRVSFHSIKQSTAV